VTGPVPGAPGLRRRKSGQYQSRARHPRTGREITRTWPAGTTEAEAKKQHRQWMALVGASKIAAHRVTLHDHLDAWLERSEATPATIAGYETAINRRGA